MKNALKLLISNERDEFNREYAEIFENAGFRAVLYSKRRSKSIRFY